MAHAAGTHLQCSYVPLMQQPQHCLQQALLLVLPCRAAAAVRRGQQQRRPLTVWGCQVLQQLQQLQQACSAKAAAAAAAAMSAAAQQALTAYVHMCSAPVKSLLVVLRVHLTRGVDKVLC